MSRVMVAVLTLVFAVPAFGINTNVFKDAPITRLSGEELKVFRGFVMKTLDETPNGMTVEWKAPKTRFTSKITPRKSFSEGDMKCREATVESDSHDRYARGLYVFCKGGKGDWEFKIPAGAKPKAKKQ